MHFTGDTVSDFELISHKAEDLIINNFSLRIIDQQAVVSTSKGLYKFIESADKKIGFTFEPATSIGSSKIDNHNQIDMIYGYGKDTIIVNANSRFAVLHRKADGHFRDKNKQLEIKSQEISEAYQKLKNTQNQLLDASWKAGMADVASNVLHNVGNALNSVNVSKNFIRDLMKNSKIQNLSKAVELINSPMDFPQKSDRGKMATEYLSRLAEQLGHEHSTYL